MKGFVLFIFCCFGGTLLAQSNALEGPALAYRPADNTQELTVLRTKRERTLLGDLDLSGLWGGPTYNYSSTGDDWALVRGGFGGLEFGDEFFVGYGGWKGREQFNVDANPTEQTGYDFQHGGFIMAYSPYRDNAIHPRLTMIVGPGKVTDRDGAQDRMLVGQAMLGLELNLFQWFRLGVDGGYRFANGVDLEDISDNDVSGAVIQIEARFGFSW